MIVALVGARRSTSDVSARLHRQLEDLPVRSRARITEVTDASAAEQLDRLAELARRASENGEALAVVAGDLVVSDRLILDVLDDPRATNRALADDAPQAANALRVSGTTVVAAGSSYHDVGVATHGFAGLVHVRAADAERAADAWRAAASTVVASSWTQIDPLSAALVALGRTGAPITAVVAGPYVAGRDGAGRDAAGRGGADSDGSLLAAAEALDEDDLAWRRASRGGDGVWSTFALRPISRRITRRAVRAGVTPNQVTVVGFVLGLLAAALVALGTSATVVAGALLLQVALVLDCVDGEIARSTRGFTAFGAWLDLVTDRVKEYAVLAAIAVTEPRLWPLAIAALGLQLTRHMADYAFADTVLAWWRQPVPDTRPFEDGSPPVLVVSGDRLGTPTGRGLVHWVKQAIHMQIGERWLLLTVALIVGVGVGGGVVPLVAYLVAVGLGLAWVLVGWTIRTLTTPRRRDPLPPDVRSVVVALRDDANKDTGTVRWTGRSWLLPAVTAALEIGALLGGAIDERNSGTRAWLFVWAFAVAWHRYDIFYRTRGGRVAVPRWVNLAGLGWTFRFVIVIFAFEHDQLGWVAPVGAGYLLLVYVPESLFHARPRALPRSLGVAKKELRRAVAVPVTRLLMRVTRPRRIALVAGLPDTEENSLVTAVILARRYPGEVLLVATEPDAARAALERVARLLGLDATTVTIVGKRGSFGAFVRAELVLYTHGLYDSPAPVGRRLHVNLWHGTGPKWNANANFAQRIGAQAHSASSTLWGHEAIRALSLGASTRIVTGNPRQDVVAAAGDRDRLRGLGLDPDRTLVVWLPTFRSSSSAGLVGLSEGAPLAAEAGRAFAAAAAEHGVQLVAKPHRLDSDLFTELGVTVITDEQLVGAGLTLYELLGYADGLLSDYSSGWVDLLDRPISLGLFVPDIAAYRRARGLNLPDLAVAADGLIIAAADAGEFFAAVAGGEVWHADGKQRCVDRIEYVAVASGERTSRMLDELASVATDLFGDDLGLHAGARPVAQPGATES